MGCKLHYKSTGIFIIVKISFFFISIYGDRKEKESSSFFLDSMMIQKNKKQKFLEVLVLISMTT